MSLRTANPVSAILIPVTFQLFTYRDPSNHGIAMLSYIMCRYHYSQHMGMP